jgi:hypothetical protein
MVTNDNENTSQVHELEEFYKLAVEKFGADRIVCKAVELDVENEAKLAAAGWTSKMLEDLKQYKQVWLVPLKKYGDELIYVCPACGEDLSGLLGGFTWGYTNGEGYCSYCNKVSFRLYHRFYDGDEQQIVQIYSLIAF